MLDDLVPPPTEIPSGPSFFQYANDDTFRGLFRAAGFVQVSVGMATVEFPLDSPDDLGHCPGGRHCPDRSASAGGQRGTA
jgi:hypothetical protein